MIYDPNKETMEYTFLIPKVKNKPKHQMHHSKYEVRNIQMGFYGIIFFEKINDKIPWYLF